MLFRVGRGQCALTQGALRAALFCAIHPHPHPQANDEGGAPVGPLLRSETNNLNGQWVADFSALGSIGEGRPGCMHAPHRRARAATS